ncbi:MAG: YDG domain-containing protein, partial [Verrucomicrobia bacterium]|nr:YDG domain-containing protein [Verrucomicrobiota bacterium]
MSLLSRFLIAARSLGIVTGMLLAGTLALRLSAAAGAPIARWVADDWAGGTATWVDRVGGKVATSYGEPVKTAGQFNVAASDAGIVFDGVNDYFEVDAFNNPIAGRTKVTIVALFKANQGATGDDGPHWQYPGPINAESGGSPNDFGLTIGADGLAHAFFNEPIPTFPPISVVDGLVHTLILTWSDPDDQGDGIAQFYVDGVLTGVSGVQDSGSGIVNDLIRFGRERETGDRWFRGTIGELRFYETIENPAEVHSSMTGTSQPPTQIPVTVIGALVNNKVYDGSTIATLNPAALLSGVALGDDVSLDTNAATASFASPSAGTNKEVNVSGLALSGRDASKYVLVDPTVLEADITRKPLNVTGFSVLGRTFDATRTAALVVSNPQLIGILDGDVVTLNSSQAVGLFDTSAVGLNKPVLVTGLVLEGKDAANYQWVSPSITASINSDGLTAGTLVAVSAASLEIAPNGEVELVQTSQLPAGALVERVVLSLEYSTYWSAANNPSIGGNSVKLNNVDLIWWVSIGTGGNWLQLQSEQIGALAAFNRSGQNLWRIGSAWNPVSLRNLTVTIHYWIPNQANQAPTDIALSAATMAENNAANAMVGTLTATDVDAGSTYTFTLVSGTGSTDNAAFNVNGNALRLTSSADFEAKSSYSVRVRATDAGGLFFEKAFAITVTDVNEAPTISTISDQTTLEDTATGAIAFTVGDVETAAGSLTVTATSSNLGVVAGGGIALGGSGANRTITLTPVANASGTSTITVTVTDGGNLTATRSFVLTVTATVELLVNPQFVLLDPLNSRKPLAWDSTEEWVEFSGSGGNDALPSVHPAGFLAFGRSSSVVVSQTVPVFPMTSSGVASFTLEYDVAKNQREGIYWVRAEFLNASGAVVTTLRRPSSGTEAAPSAWTTNQLVLNRDSLANFDQITQVRVSLFGQQSPYVWSGHYGPFFNYVSLTAVLLPNAAPTISAISDQTTSEDTATGAIAFTVGDVETAAGSLTVTATSSNLGVVAADGIALGGSGANRTITLSPVANASGTSTITVTVTDGGSLTATRSFVLTVTAVNDAPTISAISDQSTAEDTATSAIAFTVGDVETAAGSLTVTATSSNLGVVAADGIALGGSGANRTITLSP